jgi:hypothetical protein
MVETMKRFRQQFLAGLVLLLIASTAALLAHDNWSRQLPDYAYLTGWALFGLMLLLTLFNARKRLPFLPLCKAETWLQIHIYGGFFTVILFLIHLNFRAPRGGFEITLAALFMVVTLSGIGGLILSRTLPKRLQSRGGEVVYEKIPAIRHALKVQAEMLALGAGKNSPVIAEFYVRRLAGFFNGPQNFWRHLLESRRPVNLRLAELYDLRRHLSEPERVTLEQLAQLLRQKDGLDYHRALQASLKLWLFVHLPFTYGLMLFTLAHIVVVFAFSGGVR